MILNFGSINIDHVYRVENLPRAGETLLSKSYDKFLGGKGINQSIAIAKAGGEVQHIGLVGNDGDWALQQIEMLGVDTETIERIKGSTGHAIITVDDEAENQIVIESGTNQHYTIVMITTALEKANPETDWVLLQNETNLTSEIAKSAKERGFKVAYAAAPFIAKTTVALLPFVDLLAVNEGEAAALSKYLGVTLDEIPVRQLLITMGASGSELREANGEKTSCSAFRVDAVDTTGAGDTFLGSFLAQLSQGQSSETSLRYASAASAIQVTREGAATAIPVKQDVDMFLKENETA